MSAHKGGRTCANPHCVHKAFGLHCYCKACHYMYDKGYRHKRLERGNPEPAEKLLEVSDAKPR